MIKMICPRCKAENPNNVQYCQKCGFKLFDAQTIDCKICPNCGKLNALDQATCSNCHYDLSHVQAEQQTKKHFLSVPKKHSKLLLVIVTGLIIIFGAIIVCGSYFYHGWEGQEVIPLKVVRYTADKKQRLKIFYFVIVFEHHYYKKADHQYYFHGVTVNSIKSGSNISAKKVIYIYRHSPKRRINIAASSISNQNFSQIQYPAESTKWFPLKKTRANLCEGYIIINNHHYFDQIYIFETE